MAENTTLKKILDVLFEPDEPGQIDNVNEKARSNEPVRFKAEDILYDKKSKDVVTPDILMPKPEVKEKANTTFINYAPNETTILPKEEVVEPSIFEYEPSQNISPIFGPLDANKKKTYDAKNATIDYASTEKPNSSYLSMPMSPFYGFDTKKDDKPKEEVKEEVEEIEDFDITEDLGDIFATDEYKQETKESYTEEIDLFSDFYIDEDK